MADGEILADTDQVAEADTDRLPVLVCDGERGTEGLTDDVRLTDTETLADATPTTPHFVARSAGKRTQHIR